MKARNLRARFFAPPAELAGCFTSFYLLEVEVEGGARIADWLHPEWGNLRLFTGGMPETRNGADSILRGTRFTATGPSSQPTWFSLPTSRMWGIGLLPLGWAKFMDVPARQLANSISDGLTRPEFAQFRPLFDTLEEASGEDSAEAQAEVISAFFLARDRPIADGARIAAVHAALVDPDVHSAANLAERSNISIRTLERLCARYFGFPPQLLIRRQRMMRTLSAFMLHASTWSQAIDLHYTDHAHFTREFQAFMHMNPSDYAALEHPVLGAFMAERARVLGSPVQTLDPPEAPGALAEAV